MSRLVTLLNQYIPNVIDYLPELLKALSQTLVMVSYSIAFATVIGVPLGILLVVTRTNHILARPKLHKVTSTAVNLFRSTPFVILLVAILPLTRFIVGTTIGVKGAIVPLVFAAAPFIGRMVENALLEVDKGVIEAALAMGANPWQIITKVLLPEALPALILAISIATVSLIGFSATAGVVGGGGLGDFAIRFGYQAFKTDIMVVTVIMLSLLVQLVQLLGEAVSTKFLHR